MVSDVLTDTDVVVLEALEFEPGCEGLTHPQGRYGHEVASPAAWMVIAPCGETWLACNGWAVSVRAHGGFWCVRNCGEYHPIDGVRFTPIPPL